MVIVIRGQPNLASYVDHQGNIIIMYKFTSTALDSGSGLYKQFILYKLHAWKISIPMKFSTSFK